MLAGLILLQALCSLFFIADVITDLRNSGSLGDPHLILESTAAVALVAGVLFLMLELRRLLVRMGGMAAGLRAARGQMSEVMDAFFDEWHLTRAERDVAMMILKGLDNEAIARVRQTAPGTVRAQTASIYSKSATRGRAQFISLFMEELLSGDFDQIDRPEKRGSSSTDAMLKNP